HQDIVPRYPLWRAVVLERDAQVLAVELQHMHPPRLAERGHAPLRSGAGGEALSGEGWGNGLSRCQGRIFPDNAGGPLGELGGDGRWQSAVANQYRSDDVLLGRRVAIDHNGLKRHAGYFAVKAPKALTIGRGFLSKVLPQNRNPIRGLIAATNGHYANRKPAKSHFAVCRCPMPTSEPFVTTRTAIAGVSISDLAGRFGTPAYVYDAAKIVERVNDLKHFAVIRYAQKPCSTIAILALVRRLGVVVDAVSAGEVQRALAAGYKPDGDHPQIVYTADIFDRESLD